MAAFGFGPSASSGVGKRIQTGLTPGTGLRIGRQAPRDVARSAGYDLDPVTGNYVPQYQSARAKNTLYDKLSNLALTGLNTSTSTTSGGGGAAGGAAIPQVEMPQVAGPDAATTTAQGLEFGAAKSRAGSMGRASLDALRANLAERGILGGGTEARGLTDRLAAATNPLSDINVAQAKEVAETGRQRAGQEYAGKITQRGQDISAQQQQRALEVQQQMQRSSQQQQYLQQVLSSLSKLLY